MRGDPRVRRGVEQRIGLSRSMRVIRARAEESFPIRRVIRARGGER